ncbi:hypothetical protein HRbin25_00859 [bacterium HR25]|jgi:Fe-S cluster assembly iron-binding protein IscA|nr:hypothetical protein HRbin25_00859 [bacterium HR25]
MTLKVTDKAAELLREIKEELAEAPDQTLRLVQREGSFELAFDEAREGDQVYHSEGIPVLLVSPSVADLLANATIDVEETDQGPRLTLSTSE